MGDGREIIHVEEQENEIIALESIYFDKFKTLSSTPYKFSIDLCYQDFDSESASNPPSLTLVFEYGDRYPEELPQIEITNVHHLPEEKIEEMKKNLENLGERSLGTVFIYDLICACQDMLNSYLDPVSDSISEKVQEKSMENGAADGNNEEDDEELTRKKFGGTPVTVETFQKWREEFEAEMKLLKKPEIEDADVKLTGRELFQLDEKLILSDLRFLEEGEVVEDLAKLRLSSKTEANSEEESADENCIDESLFEEDFKEGELCA